jgi:hypothetical protein
MLSLMITLCRILSSCRRLRVVPLWVELLRVVLPGEWADKALGGSLEALRDEV